MFKKAGIVLAAAVVMSGCSTHAYFKMPAGQQLRLHERPQTHSQGLVKTRPYFWSAIAGVKYELVDRNGKIAKEGRLPAKFRVVSIFVPPTVIYWPVGLRYPCYDLTGAKPEQCSQNELLQLKNATPNQVSAN